MLLSVWAQDLIDHLTGHMDNEREALRAYGDLAQGAADERVQVLVRMILDDQVEDTAWQAGLVEAMELDTRKHILLLEQVQHLVRR